MCSSKQQSARDTPILSYGPPLRCYTIEPRGDSPSWHTSNNGLRHWSRSFPYERGSMMKYLIVNGDDFGASRGVNRAIVESHRYGILTSTSLLVDVPWSESAAILSRALPGLSV